jgi:hypothetical protein
MRGDAAELGGGRGGGKAPSSKLQRSSKSQASSVVKSTMEDKPKKAPKARAARYFPGFAFRADGNALKSLDIPGDSC